MAVHSDKLTDQELLERFYADGNNDWLGLLLQRYTLLLYGVCMKYMRHEEEAKDAVQQILLKVITEIGRHKVQYFKSWLYTVARNYCLMQLRAKGITPVQLQESITEDNEPGMGHEKVLHERTLALLEASMEELNPDQRQCITRFYLEKKSYQEIAVQTGFTLSQVKSHIQNGKRNLRILIEKKRKDIHQ